MIRLNDLQNYAKQTFESIKHVNEYGMDFWNARELSNILNYNKWENFKNVIEKAKESCKNSGLDALDHFADVRKMVGIGSGSERNIEDIELSRYACYLIVQNADPRKENVALGQAYFAIQTRRQEIQDEFDGLNEDQRRLSIRQDLKEHNKKLVEAANDAGVKTNAQYAIFQNSGYKGLYGGLTAKDIHEKKGLKKSHQILDHMGSTELAANLFRATQTEDKLRRDSIKSRFEANQTHFDVGKKVRDTIKDLGGTMPENLGTPDKSIKQIEREKKGNQKHLPKNR